MKKALALAVVVTISTVGLAGCATTDYYGYGPDYDGYWTHPYGYYGGLGYEVPGYAYGHDDDNFYRHHRYHHDHYYHDGFPDEHFREGPWEHEHMKGVPHEEGRPETGHVEAAPGQFSHPEGHVEGEHFEGGHSGEGHGGHH